MKSRRDCALHRCGRRTRFYAGLLGASPVAEWTGGAVFAAGEPMLLVHSVPLSLESRAYPWGRSAYLRDPDARLVELAEGPG